MSNEDFSYLNEVIKPGDRASKVFKEAGIVSEGKKDVAEAFVNGEGKLVLGRSAENQRLFVTESIDGEGTKGQIYEEMFESLCEGIEDWNAIPEAIVAEATNLWIGRICDLVAMNTDDLLNGEVCIALTDYIHINDLRGNKGNFFVDTFGKAMQIVVDEIGISFRAGETAIMGHPPEVHELLSQYQKERNKILFLLDEVKNQSEAKWGAGMIEMGAIEVYSNTLKKRFMNLFSGTDAAIEKILGRVRLSLAGTALGVLDTNLADEKIKQINAGDTIIGLQESGEIKGPRANGISAIRRGMTLYAGSGWHGMTLEELNTNRVAFGGDAFPKGLIKQCSGRKLGEIATGRSTIFNPFISRELLGGIDGIRDGVEVSGLAHVTGNPLKKISKLLGDKQDLKISLDLQETPIPPIFQILQHMGCATDHEAISQWNMGVPFVIACRGEYAEAIIAYAKDYGIPAQIIGKVISKNKQSDSDIVITNAGINSSSFEYRIGNDDVKPLD